VVPAVLYSLVTSSACCWDRRETGGKKHDLLAADARIRTKASYGLGCLSSLFSIMVWSPRVPLLVPFAWVILSVLLRLLLCRNIFLVSTLGIHRPLRRQCGGFDGRIFMMNSYLDTLSSKAVGSNPSNNDYVQARESSKKLRADSEKLASELHDLKSSLASLRTKMKKGNKRSIQITEDDAPKKRVLGSDICVINSNREIIKPSAPYPVKTNNARTGHNGMKNTEILAAKISALGSRLDNFYFSHTIPTTTYQANNLISHCIGDEIKNQTDSKSSSGGEILPGFINLIGSTMLQNNTQLVFYDTDRAPAINASIDSLSYSSFRFIRKGPRDAECAAKDSIHIMNQNGVPLSFSNSSTSICIDSESQSNVNEMSQAAPLGDENFELNSSQYISAASYGLYGSIMRTKKHAFFPLSTNFKKLSHNLATSDCLINSFSSRTFLARNMSEDSSERVYFRTNCFSARGKSLSQLISQAMKQRLGLATLQGNITATEQDTKAFSTILARSSLSSRFAHENDTHTEEETSSLKTFTSGNTNANLGVLNTSLDAYIEDLPSAPVLASPGASNLSASIVKHPILDNSSSTKGMGAQENNSSIASLTFAEPTIPCYDGSRKKKSLIRAPRQSKAADQLKDFFSRSAPSDRHEKDIPSRLIDANSFFFATPSEDDTSLTVGTKYGQIYEKSQPLTPPFFLVLPQNDAFSEVCLDSEQSIHNVQPLSDDSRRMERNYSATSSVFLTNQIKISAQNRKSHIDNFFQRGITSNLKTAITTGLCLFLLACP
jgi:hypothetical protein